MSRNWNLQNLTNTPVPRRNESVAYDTSTGLVILFGGTGGIGLGHLNDTWGWNGQEWNQIQSISAPSPRVDASLAYHAISGKIVLFGGVDADGQVLGDTWIWDGKKWTEQKSANTPSPRAGAVLVYDTARQNLVLFGGTYTKGRIGNFLNDTWIWDGRNWTEQKPANAPSPRFATGAVYDAIRSQILVVGGGPLGSRLDSDTWIWDGKNWSEQQTTNSPSLRLNANLIYDEASQQVIFFGGSGYLTAFVDTWVWDGRNWIEQKGVTLPKAGRSSIVYDTKRQNVVLFVDGGDKQHRVAETWVGI